MTKCNHCQVYSNKDYGTCSNCGAPLTLFSGHAMNITAKWTGRYPSLCCGHWEIIVDGEYLPIPEDKAQETMNTYGTYESWHFDEHWSEVFEDYQEGMYESEWFDENKSWIDVGLAQIKKHFGYMDYCALYEAIRKEDFRRGSCGGCI